MNKEIGIIGLGKMGANLALNAVEKGIRVFGSTLEGLSPEVRKAGVVEIKTLQDFKSQMKGPRKIFIYIPAGPAVDAILDQMSQILDKGDILIDGGNSYWGDSIRRHEKLAKKGIEFIDLGTSGGVSGARNGACFMVGGNDRAVAQIEPILKAMCIQGGYVHAGPPGAGHFVKLVHNGIEFGMLQAIGEGMDLLEHYHTKLNIKEVLHCWRFGSVIRSWLIDLMEEAYRSNSGMEKIPAFVEDTGEVNWLVCDAMQMEVCIPVIAEAVVQLFASRDNKKNWARAVAMMRHGFGGHPYGPDAGIVRERREGRVGDYFRPPTKK
jgi:6-phosphogluconate dehydrogenase